jgi:2-polyprenyl-3-methyl-5-hydroxy-6-metoxy-1,4-benzoquinol methylase
MMDCFQVLLHSDLCRYSTARSYALAILAAERILSWVPPGTHDHG